MILSAQSIRTRCYSPNELIRPFSERATANGMSYGLSSCGYDIRIKDSAMVFPSQMSLASSVEYFDLPNDLLMRIVDKSTWARLGIAVQNTVAEPGWRGYLTLEITNHTREHKYIPAGSPIAQVLFELLDQPTIQPYEGKYQNQPDRVVEAILE